MKNIAVFQKRNYSIVCVMLVLLLGIASFYDFQISSMVFNEENVFGIFLASYGQLPAMLCVSIGGILLLPCVKDSSTIKKIIGYSCSLLLSAFAVLGITLDPMLYIKDMNLLVSLLIAITIVVVVDVCILRFTKDTDPILLRKFIMVLLITMFVEIILINVIKIPWARPRMRMIMMQEQAHFQPWWVIGSGMKETLMALGVAAEEFKSFPSGHTGNASCAILLGLLPLLNSKLKGKENLLFFSGITFAVIVAFSRIIMGAHFLSDVTIGMGVTCIIAIVTVRIVFKHEITLS